MFFFSNAARFVERYGNVYFADETKSVLEMPQSAFTISAGYNIEIDSCNFKQLGKHLSQMIVMKISS